VQPTTHPLNTLTALLMAVRMAREVGISSDDFAARTLRCLEMTPEQIDAELREQGWVIDPHEVT